MARMKKRCFSWGYAFHNVHEGIICMMLYYFVVNKVRRKKTMKKIISVLMLIVMSIGTLGVSAMEIKSFSEDVYVYYLGVDVYADTENKPLLINGRTMVPLRPIFEMMGWEDEQILWFPEEEKAIFQGGDTACCFVNGSASALKFAGDGTEEEVFMDVEATIYNGNFYIPLRAYCELWRREITWEESTRSVYILGPENFKDSNRIYRYEKRKKDVVPEVSEEPLSSSVIGVYAHPQYPENYGVVITAFDGVNIEFDVYAIKGEGSRVTGITVSDTVENGICQFDFEDTFGNAGTGVLELNQDGVSISFDVLEYQGGWCIDAAAGSYAKTGELPEDYDGQDDLEEDLILPDTVMSEQEE